jgi:hypothetical protein
LELRECRPSFRRLFSLSGHGWPAREKALMDGLTELICHAAPVAENSTSSQEDVAAPRSPARAQLALAIAELARVAAELADAQEPALRLGAVIAEAARREAEIAALRAADEARLGAWLAEGAAGPRPKPDPATIEAEERRAALVADAIAARSAFRPPSGPSNIAPSGCAKGSAGATQPCAAPQSTRRTASPSAIARR